MINTLGLSQHQSNIPLLEGFLQHLSMPVCRDLGFGRGSGFGICFSSVKLGLFYLTCTWAVGFKFGADDLELEDICGSVVATSGL